ncbi:restriction endonuclease [Sphingobacterium faecium]|uniref:restriction endonuclease n=1 Tax=Sphingobacterium faecium TaxID=34087 RepID=UPI00320B2937
MTWQEYQLATSKFYEKFESFGKISHNILIPDRLTGQNRQVDVWGEIYVGNHIVTMLIDAKFRKDKLDIKDVEEVEALGRAVKANKVAIVTSSGWTEPAEKYANLSSIDLRIMNPEQALDLIIENKWFMCYSCKDECVIMDSDGAIYQEDSGLFFIWYSGKCRNCKDIYFHCPACGDRKILEKNDKYKCDCNHIWKKNKDELMIKFKGFKSFQRIDNKKKIPVEFLFWANGYPKEFWGRLVFSTLEIDTDKGNSQYFLITPDGGLATPDYLDEDGPSFFFPIQY